MGFTLNLLRGKICHSPWSIVENCGIIRYVSEIGKHSIRRLITSHKYIVWLYIPMLDAMLVKESNRI